MPEIKELDTIIRDIDRKVSVLFAAEEHRKVTCPHQVQRIDAMEKSVLEFQNREVYKRIGAVEKAVITLQKDRDKERNARKLIIGLLLGLGGLVSWGFDVIPKIIGFFTRGPL